ncbi:putative Beta-N-acetylhexosaminidase [Megalodesulfovibrio gigas DSM 1382 = ATCC 19364]|uniref:Putative Beta-N-acetylhexosaminidase n=2 Tax=Megalodesulfovibrio gigas TaxID=879 RepID=T2GEU1_MEGG1|nr:putative Beta-N-acetylhexosaminidase [Megalodesulfovibrio gigas DSM 1382 = ATCC 19364]
MLAALALMSPISGAVAAPAPTLAEMAGQMLMVGFRGQTLAAAPDTVRALRAGQLGGVILFDFDVAAKTPGRNIVSPAQLAALTREIAAAAPTPPFIAVDQEGGRVMRLKAKSGFPDWPSAADMGAQGASPANRATVQATGRRMGTLLREQGLTLNFAPVLDVNVNPENPVIGKIGRSFSSDAEVVEALGTAFMQGLSQGGVLPCVKHFPGHGSSREDSHLGLPDVTTTWTARELSPFQAAIAAGCPMVMTAHLFNAHWDPTLPATLSPRVLQGMLRRELGFRGVIVSDDMQMAAITGHYGMQEAVRLAVLAGVDMLIFGNNLQHDPAIAAKAHAMLMELVARGEIPAARIQESYTRIMALKRSIR